MSSIAPPGTPERITAARVLVIAPHFDDEVLGCGGLLASLAAAGAAVHVLYLTDSAGGVEGLPAGVDRASYRATRRGEADRAAAILGLSGIQCLDLPDGGLIDFLDDAAAAIDQACLTHQPELLLVPSPLEASRDHRAAFAALHRLLAPLRDTVYGGGGRDDRAERFANVRFLVYEVNRAAFPDVLVDVSAEAEVLEQAISVYASQEQRHPYGNAAFGLRRHRTLSLGPAVTLAEGYRRLDLSDFATRSPAELIRHLGGLPDLLEVHEGPKISVVVRTSNRPELLAEALASLATQSYRRVEVILVNDGGEPPQVADEFPFPLVRVDHQTPRGRAAAAQAGIDAASGDAIAFLDDDDLAYSEHLAMLAGAFRGAGVRVAYTDATVAVYELGASGWTCRERRLPYSRDFDADLLALDNYIPFNTVLIERALLSEIGPLDLDLPIFEDWDLLIRLSSRVPFHHIPLATAEYRHFRGAAHHAFGERPRERADFLAVKARVLAKHAERIAPERLARAVATLRDEQVQIAEAFAERRRAATELSARLADSNRDLAELAARHGALARERFDWEERFHTKNGEATALASERESLRADIARLYDEEAKLRAVVFDQSAHLARTYAEIERLNGVIQAMENTRAWRLHQRFAKRS